MKDDTGPSREDPGNSETGNEMQRAKAAKFITQQRSSINIRIHRLLHQDARKITDTEEIMSTALRRIDRIIHHGKLRAENDTQFYALVHRVIEKTILEKARVSRRIIARERVKAALDLKRSQTGIAPGASEMLERVGRLISDPIDREIVLLRGRGLNFESIAESMRMQPAAVRQRWSRMKLRVSILLDGDQTHEGAEP